MCVVSGGVSSGAASSTYPRWSRVPLLEAEHMKGNTTTQADVFCSVLFPYNHYSVYNLLLKTLFHIPLLQPAENLRFKQFSPASLVSNVVDNPH